MYWLRLSSRRPGLRPNRLPVRSAGLVAAPASRQATAHAMGPIAAYLLYRLVPSLLNSAVVIQPGTIVRWHRAGFRSYWRWKSRSRVGRPKVPIEVRSLIRRISVKDPLWGAPRIHGELLKLGIEVAQSTVAKYMAKRRPGKSGQTWKTFLRNHVACTGAMDFLVVPTINFRLLFVLVILRHERRRLISSSVTDHPTAEWIARQITEAFPWDEVPTHLIRDRDGAYGHAVTRLRRRWASGITRLRLVHPGRMAMRRDYWPDRRKCLDHIVILDEEHLRRVLKVYAAYYDRVRPHLPWPRMCRWFVLSSGSAKL